MDKQTEHLTSADFEQKIGELQKIVGQLESDPSVTLEDSMRLFENGLSLTQECVDELLRMQERIDELNARLDTILRRPLIGGGGDED